MERDETMLVSTGRWGVMHDGRRWALSVRITWRRMQSHRLDLGDVMDEAL